MTERKYRVATFNLKDLQNHDETFHRHKKYSLREYKEKIAWTGEMLREMKSDLVACQEVFSQKALTEAAARAGFKPEHIYMTQAQQDAVAGHALVTRLPVHKVTEISRFPEGYNTTSLRMGMDNQTVCLKRFTRPVLKAEVEMNGQRVTVFSSHLRSGNPAKVHDESLSVQQKEQEGRNRSAIIQITEAKALRALIKKELEQNPKTPIIVLGDFNQDINGPVQKIIRGHEEVAQSKARETAQKMVRHQLQSSVNVLKTKNGAANDAKNEATFIHKGTPKALDDVLLSPHFEVMPVDASQSSLKSVQILNSHLTHGNAAVAASFSPVSDHAPVIAEIGLIEKKKGPQGKKAQKLAKKKRLQNRLVK